MISVHLKMTSLGKKVGIAFVTVVRNQRLYLAMTDLFLSPGSSFLLLACKEPAMRVC